MAQKKATKAPELDPTTTSLTFLDGEEMLLAGLPKGSVPTIRLLIKSGDDERVFYDVPTYTDEITGEVRFAVPPLPDDGPPQYLVCGTVITAGSYTYPDWQKWKKFSQEHDLVTKQNAISALWRETLKELGNSDEESTITDRLKNLRAAREAMLAKELEDFESFTDDDEQKLGRLNTRISSLEVDLETLQRTPEELQNKAGSRDQELEKLTHAQRKEYLEFVHDLAHDQGLTTDTFETWLAGATGDDLNKAMTIVRLGNAGWTATAEPQALNKQQRRAHQQQSGRTLN